MRYNRAMKRNTLGIFIIIIGIALMFASLNIGNAQELLGKLWPLLLIGLGLIQLTDTTRQKNWWPWVLIGVGGFFLADNLFEFSFNIWNVFWPAVVIAFGVSFLRQNTSGRAVPTAESDGDITAVLGGAEMRNTSDEYRGNRVTAIMGGVELDLSKAVIKKTATLDVNVVMGGIELRVPEQVIVKNRTTNILGGFEDKTRPTDKKDAPTLFVSGTILMGGVEIKR